MVLSPKFVVAIAHISQRGRPLPCDRLRDLPHAFVAVFDEEYIALLHPRGHGAGKIKPGTFVSIVAGS